MYNEVLHKFTKAIDWIEGEGLSVQRSRIYHYKSELEKLSKWETESSVIENVEEKGVPYWQAILYETFEIYEIYHSLKDILSPDIPRRLKQISKGPIFLADELATSSSNAARNYQFELLMASRFKEAGLNISLDEKDDFVIGFANGSIPIECKRPQSASQVNKRIKEGCSQIKQSFYGLPPGSRFPGILVMGIEKLDSQHEKLLVASSVDNAKKALGERCFAFRKKYLERVQEKSLSHVGGFIVSSNTMSEIYGRLQYGSFRASGYWADQQVAEHIRTAFSKGS